MISSHECMYASHAGRRSGEDVDSTCFQLRQLRHNKHQKYFKNERMVVSGSLKTQNSVDVTEDVFSHDQTR